MLPICMAAASSSFSPMVTFPVGRALSASRASSGAVLLDPRRLLAKQPRNFLQDVNESRTPEAGFFRK
jgi:hypothetical protein